MKYFTWRMKKGLHKTIQLYFFPVGHTKFYPDLCFGLFKRKFWKSDCYSLQDALHVASQACPTPGAFTSVPVGNEEGEVMVKTYHWLKYFKSVKTIPQILSYNHLEMVNNGTVSCKKRLADSSETEVLVLPDIFQIESFPSVIEPENLNAKRRRYIVEKLAEFIPKNRKKEFLCNRENLEHEISKACKKRMKYQL